MASIPVVIGVVILLVGMYRAFSPLIAPPESTRTPTNFPSLILVSGTGTPCADEARDINLDFGQVVAHTICPEGDTDTFRFSGSRGDRIRIQVTYESGTMRPCLELIAPDDTRTKACDNAFNNVIATTLDQTGSYTIVVHVLFVGVGDYTLVVERL